MSDKRTTEKETKLFGGFLFSRKGTSKSLLQHKETMERMRIESQATEYQFTLEKMKIEEQREDRKLRARELELRERMFDHDKKNNGGPPPYP